MDDINKYFEILGLKSGASLKEVKEAYKDLVKVWHPDRYAHDSKLQAKVTEKLKEINGAYQKVQDFLNNPYQYQQATGTNKNEYDKAKESAKTETKQSSKTNNREDKSSSQPPPFEPVRRKKKSRNIAAWSIGIIGLFIVASIVIFKMRAESPQAIEHVAPYSTKEPKSAPPKDLFKEAGISPLSKPQSAPAPAPQDEEKPSIPNPDNGNSTVTDNNTGLMWQQGENPTTYNWYQASGTYDATYNPTSQDVCGALTIGGHSDWRLPSQNELSSIVGKSNLGTKLSYWSSTTSAGNPDGAWGVDFNDGFGGYVSKSSYGGYVRCVRGGQ